MNTAIVLGATGVVGEQLIQQLITDAQFDTVVAVTRRPVTYHSDKVRNAVIDFDAMADVSEVFRGDVLFSCLGTTLKQAGSVAGQRRVDLDYQHQAATLAAHNGVSRYVLVSSTGANAASPSAYLQMKGELEQQIAQLPFAQISILQPSLIIGQRKEFRLSETLASWLLPTLCKLPVLRRYRPITGAQVAAKMRAVSLSQTAARHTYRLEQVFPDGA